MNMTNCPSWEVDFMKRLKIRPGGGYFSILITRFCTIVGAFNIVYKLLNDIKGSNNSTKVSALNNCTDSSEIAHKFNLYFTGIADELRKSLPNAPCSTELETVQHSMFLRKVSMAEVLKILISFENKSSSGDDNVNMIIVKKSASVIAPYLELLINCSFAQRCVPFWFKAS